MSDQTQSGRAAISSLRSEPSVPALTEEQKRTLAWLTWLTSRYETKLKVEFVALADGRCEVRCEIESDL